jgi:glutamine---fructose-6-phosphate transaminase (isomerizing)
LFAYLPEQYGPLSPIMNVVPLQLLAYHTACARGTEVDTPRNLAKSVAVARDTAVAIL